MLSYDNKRFVEKYDLKIDFGIPNTMNAEGLIFLAALAKTVPENGQIVEAGSFFGSTAYVFAKNAPTATIYCVDPWEHEPWMSKWLGANQPKPPNLSIDAFKAYTHGLENIIPIQGYSPDAYTRPYKIDLFFEDSTHTEPVFSQNMKHFGELIKSGGILCGDDFGTAFPDVRDGVLRTHKEWGRPMAGVRGTVWAFSKAGKSPLGAQLASFFEEFFDMIISLEEGDDAHTTGFGFAIKKLETAVTKIEHPPEIEFVLRHNGKEIAASDNGTLKLPAGTTIDEVSSVTRDRSKSVIIDFIVRTNDGEPAWSKRTSPDGSRCDQPGVLTNLKACFRVV